MRTFVLALALVGCRPVEDTAIDPGTLDVDEDGIVAASDCDDDDPTRSPAAAELCDGIDNNCDGEVDEEAPGNDGDSWADVDGDGFGDPTEHNHACEPGGGWVDDATDCDDADADINPDADEVAYDGVDNDCDASSPDDDLDSDGYLSSVDCDDNAADVNPGASEIWDDGIDNDCDADTSDTDADGDGYAEPEDCDDGDATVGPDATEVPYDGIDNDCDASTLDDDLDEDGFALDDDCDDDDEDINPDEDETPYDGIDNDCDAATLDDDLDEDGYVEAVDCDDSDDTINPGADEVVYDGDDNDCRSSTPDDDLDDDGYPLATDCDDDDDTVNPGVDEVWYDGIDQNCDEANDYDQDGDGYDSDDYGGTDCADTVASTTECGQSADAPLDTCLDLEGTSEPTGVYWVDPPGNSRGPVEAWCDMESDSGGYTMLKVQVGSALKTPAVESECATYGMRLLIPRSPDHQREAAMLAYNPAVGPDANGAYVHLMGVYADYCNGGYDGGTCVNTEFRSGNPVCEYHAADDGPFYVHDWTDYGEPNGDCTTGHSIGYTFNSSGDLTALNDWTDTQESNRFICITGDKLP